MLKYNFDSFHVNILQLLTACLLYNTTIIICLPIKIENLKGTLFKNKGTLCVAMKINGTRNFMEK